MIESLIQNRGLKAVKVAGTHGGEWACPCPACGGKDRFRFWPAQGEGGTWYCRQCDKGGDSIQFLREFEGLSYTEACRRLGVERAAAPTSIMPRADKAERPWEPSPTPADPGPVWQEHAAKLLDYAHARLLADEDRMMWLAMRGIFPDAVERFRLGWLPGENGKDCYHRDRGAWGLPPETNARGRKKSLWIPAGLVVPALTEDGAVRRLRIRRTDEARARFGAEMKYVVVPGSSMRPLLLRPEARAFVVADRQLADATTSRLSADAQLKRYQAERARLKLEKEQGLLMPRAEHERDLGARALFFRNEVRNFIHLHGATLIHLVGGDEGRLRELVQWWMETTEIWMDAWSGEREFVVNEEDDGADADAPGEEDA